MRNYSTYLILCLLTVNGSGKFRFQARLEMSKSELEISKRSEERLVAENTSLQREQRSQTVLLSNLQSMQQSMEKQAFEVCILAVLCCCFVLLFDK